MIRSKRKQKKIVIDLTGPDGNAFALMGRVRTFGRLLGWTNGECQDIVNEMTDGDYEHLVEVFDREFGDFVILER